MFKKQESNEEEVDKFINLLGLEKNYQKKYGDIVKQLIENDSSYQDEMNNMVKKYVK